MLPYAQGAGLIPFPEERGFGLPFPTNEWDSPSPPHRGEETLHTTDNRNPTDVEDNKRSKLADLFDFDHDNDGKKDMKGAATALGLLTVGGLIGAQVLKIYRRKKYARGRR